MRALIIHNQMSGFGSDAIYEFERALAEQGDEVLLRIPAADFVPKDVLYDVDSFDMVVLSGGDGTMASLLYYLRGSQVPTCVFPSGTSNLLFLNLGNAPDSASIARACRIGRTVTTDLGEMTWTDENNIEHTKGFCLMSGLGYDGEFMRMAAETKSALGEAAYFAAAVKTLNPPVSHFTITIDGKTFERNGISCIVANNAMIQGDIKIVPENTMTDGLLDVIVLEVNQTVELLPSVVASILDKTGKVLERPMIESFRGKCIEVQASNPMALQIDGDPMANNITTYRARVLEKANRLLVDEVSFYASQATQPDKNLPGAQIVPHPFS
ncbi:MAG: diacylglycerol kinase family protein [Atopobium sp.]|uniref:diacylglycerol/lipid kinase family protein n=1 Tax=Atopobium sp. TaxID=1872650 RepID=UPI002A75A8F5|nr:diacylglycerol kinase family protein [Atopobium sp.]MDY2788177.1 diacylglycerol kinase family protein [Atopobium sp.]